MPSLQFKRCFVPRILDGSKAQTLRARLGGGFAIGRMLSIMNGYRPDALVGRATIASVDAVLLSDLTEHDARLDGFATLTDLHAAIALTYPGRDRLVAVRWRDFTPAR